MSKSRLFRLGLVALAVLAASPLTACIVDVAGTPYAGRAPVGVNPVINAIAANPTSIADKDTPITFTVNTSDPTGPLQYTWSATKGTLSATSGQSVFWRPVKSDGSLEAAGLATVTLLVTNSRGGTASSSLNLTIKDNGATDVGTSTAPAPSASPSAAPSATPTPAPSASATPAASPSPSASPEASPSPSASPVESASPSPSPSASASPEQSN